MGEYDGMDYTWAQHQYECEQNLKRRKTKKQSCERHDSLDDFLTEREKLLEEIEREDQELMKEFFEEKTVSVPQPEDPKAFCKLLDTKGTYAVKMKDGTFRQVNTFGTGGMFSFGKIIPLDDKGKPVVSSLIESPNLKKPTAVAVSTDSLIVLDGSNVIGIDKELRTKVLQAVVIALENAGYKNKVFVDKTIFSWLRNKMQDEDGANYLSDGEKKGLIIVAPNKTEADGQILQLAEFEKNAHIITNDRYRDYAEMHPWLNDRGAANRLHGVNVVTMGNGTSRILVAGFNLDITVQA